MKVVDVFFRTGYNYDRDAVSEETGDVPEGESLTVQSEKEESDINTIVKRFGLVGSMPENPRVPMFGDFTDLSDYQSALDVVRAADSAFMELTPEVRSRFENNPQKLMDFCTAESLANPANLAEARKLGLVPEEAAVPAPLLVRVVPEPPAVK